MTNSNMDRTTHDQRSSDDRNGQVSSAVKYPLSREEMRDIRQLITDLREEVHHPGAWYANDRPDPAELDSEVDDALERLTHALGEEG